MLPKAGSVKDVILDEPDKDGAMRIVTIYRNSDGVAVPIHQATEAEIFKYDASNRLLSHNFVRSNGH